MLACTLGAAQAQSENAASPSHWRFGIQLGTVQDRNNTEPTAQATLGYDIDRTWSIEALVHVSVLFMRVGGLNEGEREFDSAVGARVLATLPLNDRWRLVGGLGIVQFQDDAGGALGETITNRKTSPMVSLAAMYRLSRRWSLGLETSSYTRSQTFNAGLRAEMHF